MVLIQHGSDVYKLFIYLRCQLLLYFFQLVLNAVYYTLLLWCCLLSLWYFYLVLLLWLLLLHLAFSILVLYLSESPIFLFLLSVFRLLTIAIDACIFHASLSPFLGDGSLNILDNLFILDVMRGR